MRFETSKEMLDAWDAGQDVISVSMGGLGGGYEQAIQIMAFELLRELIRVNPNLDVMSRDQKQELIDGFDKTNPELKRLIDEGITGAMHGAALNLALNLYQRGPKAMDEVEPRRLIVVNSSLRNPRP